MPVELIAAALAVAPQGEIVESASFSLIVGSNENPALVREAAPVGSMRDWISIADIPVDSIPKLKWRFLRLRVEVGTDGAVTDCVAESREPLTDIACAKLRERGQFIPALDREGHAVPDAIYLTLDVGSGRHIVGPPAPPPPPMPSGIHYNLMRASSGLRIEAQPEWKAFVPHDGRRNAEVALGLYRYTYKGETKLSCYAVASSGDKSLDDSTCAGLQTARYGSENEDFKSATIMVRWKGDVAQIVLPSRDHGSAVEFDRSAAEKSVATLPGVTKKGFARLTFPADGQRVRCKIVRTTGLDAADLTACRKLEKIRFEPATDIYERRREGVEMIPIGS